MGIEAQRYRGWWVFALPQQGYWIAQCCRSLEREVCTGKLTFAGPLDAINAAKDFVDQVLSKSVLLYVLDYWLEVGKIDQQEYEKLVQSIYQVAPSC